METSPVPKKHIITLAGPPGSGKTTASKKLAQQLGYDFFYSGDLFRAIVKERGYELQEGNIAAEQAKEIDHQVDTRLRQIGADQDNLVIDSRMAWHWMPFSFKVYLDLDLEVAAQRIINEMSQARLKHEHVPTDPKEYAAILKQRLDSETRRYKSLYSADPYNRSNYDLVVDTSHIPPDQVVGQILEAYRVWQ